MKIIVYYINQQHLLTILFHKNLFFSGNEVLISLKFSKNKSKQNLGTFLLPVSGFQILMIATCLMTDLLGIHRSMGYSTAGKGRGKNLTF